ncbi:MAG: hypothetical protein ACETWK_02175 [Candidatus Aminicenantaceae bacterium]
MPQKTYNFYKQRRIAVFEPRPKLMTNPSLVSLIEAFTQNGAQVDVMMPVSASYPSIDSRLATRYPFPKQFSLWRGGIRETLRGWLDLREKFKQNQIDSMFTAGAYDLIIGVDSEGLIKGYEYAKRYKLPLVYLSFEIIFRDELRSRWEIEKKEEESIASQFADLIIIQDKWRAELLTTENRISPERIEYLPVSPRSSKRTPQSNHLRKRFNISERETIVLHSGTFAEFTCASELLDSVSVWPEGFVLIIHTRYKPRKFDGHIRAIGKAMLSNVFLSTDPLAPEEYEKLVASADIGLVLYKQVPPSPYEQKNIQTMGLSSGKFSYYMKYGLPVISIKQDTYAQLLNDYKFGENIDSFEEMPKALKLIQTNYAYYSAEAKRLFSEKLSFDIHWPRLSARLLEVMK